MGFFGVPAPWRVTPGRKRNMIGLTDMTQESIQVLRERLELRERQLEAVHSISEALASQSDVHSVLRETLRVVLQSVDAEAGSLMLYDKEKRRLVFEYVEGKIELLGREIDPETDLTGKAATVFRTGQSIITSSTYAENYNSRFDRDTGFKTQSIITVPLKHLGGSPIGVMQALNKRHERFTQADQELLEIVSSLAATSIMNARLAEEAQLAAVARAVGDLSHDIKNALTPIESMVDTTVETFIEPMYQTMDEFMPDWQKKAPEVAHSVQNVVEPLRFWYPEVQSSVKDGCSDIREMVSEIADYIKGTQSTHIVENDLKDVLVDRLRRLQVVAQQRRVTLHLENLEDVPSFAFDRRLVGRAVFNLINNAMGAINDSVKKKQLELRPFNVWIRAKAVEEGTYPGGNFCLLEVVDDGPGMPAKVRESLFTPQAISTTIGGTGIGTRFVKGVADAHGGEVGVESEPGHGARFWMRLPLRKG
jgi:signal transduction histidine kinase